MWTLHPNLENLVKEWWGIKVEGTTMFRVATKLKNVKKNIKIWNKHTFGKIFENKFFFWRNLKIYKIGFRLMVMRWSQGRRKVVNWLNFMTLLPRRRCFGDNVLERSF